MAGAFGQALLDVRAAARGDPHDGVLWKGTGQPGSPLADGDLTNEELRSAMAAHATWFEATDYQPAHPLCLTAAQVGGAPVPLGPAPWTSVGWGYTGPAEARAAAAWLLGGPAPTAKPMEATLWMDGLGQARAALKG